MPRPRCWADVNWVIVVGLFAAACFLGPGAVVCQSSVEDRACLGRFRDSLDDRFRLADWEEKNTTMGVCGWRGVFCDQDRVTGLNLSWAGLSGRLVLYGCSALSGLNLAGNGFAGGIPDQICENLPNLTSLDLAHNSFSQSIPSFSSCLRLRVLDLEANVLVGPVPEELGLLPLLTELNLSSNQLSGSIPGTLLLSSGNPRFSCSSFSGNENLTIPSYCNGISLADSSGSKLVDSLIVIGAFTCLVLVSVGVKLALWKLSRVRSAGSLKEEPVRILSRKLKKLKPLKVHHLLTATANFSEAHILGSGGCSTVYKGILGDGTVVAIKLLSVGQQTLSQKTLEQTFRRELETFLRSRHRNLVRILGCVAHVKMKLLILEYMPHGSLEQQLYGPDLEASLGTTFECRLSWDRRYKIALGVALGLQYLHHECPHSLVHGDLKPSNILLDADFEPHISDFGMAKLVNPSYLDTQFGSDAHLGTIGYTAPEKAYSLKTSPKEDVYSFGILMLELLTRQRPTSACFGEGVTISEWVERGLASHATLLQYIIDPQLLQSSDYCKEHLAGIILMLKLGVICTKQQPSVRPEMRTVTKLLQQVKEAEETPRFVSVDKILQEVGLTPFLPTYDQVGTITFSID